MEDETWLHLSDWYQRRKDFNRQVVRDALIEDRCDQVRITPDSVEIEFLIFNVDVACLG